MKYYSDIKSEIMSFAGKWVELAIIMLSEINQDQRAYVACSHSFVNHKIFLTHLTILFIYLFILFICA
jgi:hypothetical protein